MMIKSINFIFVGLILSLINDAWSSSGKYSPNLQYRKSLFKVSYSKSDYLFAESLSLIFKQLENKKIKQSLAKKLLKNFLKAKSFKGFKNISKRIYNISRIGKNKKRFHAYCNPKGGKGKLEKKKNTSLKLKTELDQALSKYCHYKFFSLIKRYRSRLSKKDFNYLKRFISFYLHEKNLDIIISYLRNIDLNSRLYKDISSLITEKYIALKIKPHQKILPYMEIDGRLTYYIQSIGFKDVEVEKYFVKEFKKIIKKADLYLQKKEVEKAQTYISYAQSFYSQNKKYIDSNIAWRSFISTGKNFLYLGNIKKIMAIFDHVMTLASNEEQKDESLFYMIWPFIFNKDYKQAVKEIHRHKMVKNFDHHSSKLKFWIASSIYYSGQKKKAQELYNKLITNNPLSFYSIIAVKNFNRKGQNTLWKRLNQSISPESRPHLLKISDYSPAFMNALKRLLIWMDLKNDTFSYWQLEELLNTKKNDAIKKNKLALTENDYQQEVVFNLTYLLSSKKLFLHTFKIIHGLLQKDQFEFNNHIVKILFPFPYLSQIKKIERDIDPIVILSVIRQESAFNPTARSIVGARGLMQLMPATARRFRRRLRPNILERPKVNLKIGIKYLKQLTRKYKGNLIYTLAAYNAGERRLNDWIKRVFVTKDPLITIESIPFKETKQYVKLIYRNIFFYGLISGKQENATSIKESFKIALNPNSKKI